MAIMRLLLGRQKSSRLEIRDCRRSFRQEMDDHNSSVLLNGSPRSPLNWARRRLSLELHSRRITGGATFSPPSRRARRPLSQSSQLITSFMGIVGTPLLEGLGCFIDKFLNLVEVAAVLFFETLAFEGDVLGSFDFF